MNSITLALSTDEQPVPGIDAVLGAVLFVMHAPAVRDWVYATRAAAGNQGLIVIADDEWVNPGGYESVTIPVSKLDRQALTAIRSHAALVRAVASGG